MEDFLRDGNGARKHGWCWLALLFVVIISPAFSGITHSATPVFSHRDVRFVERCIE